jgi:hypothetical protein
MTSQKAPGTGIDTEATTSNAIDTLVYKALEAESKKSEPIYYTGYSLYSTLIPIATFVATYDLEFVKKVMTADAGATAILESYIFVPEICNFLPQPDLNILKDINDTGQVSQSVATSRLAAMKKIERFPRGYQARKGANILSFLAPVNIMFDRDFDYSTGVLSTGI